MANDMVAASSTRGVRECSRRAIGRCVPREARVLPGAFSYTGSLRVAIR